MPCQYAQFNNLICDDRRIQLQNQKSPIALGPIFIQVPILKLYVNSNNKYLNAAF
jgi:hypothetical protein